MKYLKLILLMGSICSVMSCKTKETIFNPGTYEKPMITFGSGGGFTGRVISYSLTSGGDLYTSNHDQYTLLGKADKKVVNQIFANYKSLGLKELMLDEPGNKYYFIEFKSKDINKNLKWGLNPLDNKNLSVFYNILLDLSSKMMPEDK